MSALPHRADGRAVDTAEASSEAAELGGAAQGVGHTAGGAEDVDQAQEDEAAAVDAEHGCPGRPLIEMFAYLSALFRTMPRRPPSASTW